MLLPEQYPTEPYYDATPLLNKPTQLCDLADELGYLYFKGLLPEELIAPVRAFAREEAVHFGWVLRDDENPPQLFAQPDAKLTGRGWDDPNWLKIQRKLCDNLEFKLLATCHSIMDVLQTLYNEPATLAVANHLWLKLPGSPEHTTRPHQDIFYLPDCPRMWTVWIPLSETPLDVGPLGIVPGSHKRNWHHIDAMTGIDVPRDVKWATNSVLPGDLVFFGAHTIHCAWSNISPLKVRLSLDVRYEPQSVPRSILKPQ